MKLTYRGVSYDSLPATLEVTEGDILGRYRGQVVRRHCVTQTVDRPDVESVLLHYRGGTYAIQQPVVKATAQQQQEAAAAACPVRVPQLSKLMGQDARRVHLENMRRSLERRIRTAQAQGDEQLITLLQQESHALSSV
ncbi:hypothetical protein AWQ21_00700 [Picosynechococcus sp. PCC 7003]|uniref:DUF4278 domain-containing protein n=1 Tax=Picosynechococcus sp. PCC 7003 TaxID=374981 RepID=UPI000810C3C6|nr:DUF4278 domain-containing protein [Picosynechococcus sp. PCC 7003]ANV85459.1 hypothetical protein AWQ21_00700 [Picosynechococcus sp. PCC 7003]